MKKILVAGAVSSLLVLGNAQAATEYKSSIQDYLDSSASVLIGTVENRGNAQNSEFVLSNAYSVSRNGRQQLQERVSLRSARSVYIDRSNIQRRDQNNNGSEPRLGTRMNEALPDFSVNKKYLIFMNEDGNYSSKSTFLVNPDETVSTLDGIPIVVDEEAQTLRRAKIEYDLSGVEERLLRDSDGGNDRILYYSKAQINYTEKPSSINAIVDVVTRKMTSTR